MDFNIKNKLENQLKEIEEFLNLEVYPLEGDFLSHKWDILFEAIKSLRQKVKKMGLWAPNLPVELGGSYTNLHDLALIGEVLGRSPLGHYIFGCQAPDAGNAELLHLFGTESQKHKYLKPLAKGEIRSCFAMTEPDTAGSNPTLLESQAKFTNGNWVINAVSYTHLTLPTTPYV